MIESLYSFWGPIFYGGSIALNWLLPRKLGVDGIFLGQIGVFFLVIMNAFVDDYMGRIADMDGPYSFSLVILTVALNTLLLPLAIWATVKHRRDERLMDL